MTEFEKSPLEERYATLISEHEAAIDQINSDIENLNVQIAYQEADLESGIFAKSEKMLKIKKDHIANNELRIFTKGLMIEELRFKIRAMENLKEVPLLLKASEGADFEEKRAKYFKSAGHLSVVFDGADIFRDLSGTGEITDEEVAKLTKTAEELEDQLKSQMAKDGITRDDLEKFKISAA